MKLVVQRVKNAQVEVEGKLVGKIEQGFLVLLGVTHSDTKDQADYLVKKLCKLRVFTDENDKMNLSLIDTSGEMLIVSQFTLCGACKKGTRPSFDKSAPPEVANELYEYFIKEVQSYGIKTGTGVFGAMMEVELINDGPVTFMLEAHNG